MKRMVFSFSFLLFVSGINAQITLEECQRKTQENYPLVHQYGLVEKTKEYNLENAAKGYLPQFALFAVAGEEHRTQGHDFGHYHEHAEVAGDDGTDGGSRKKP